MAEGEKEHGGPKPARVAGPMSVLAHGLGTHAVVVVPAPMRQQPVPLVSRRGLLLTAFWADIGALGAAAVAALINVLWPRSAQQIGGTFALDVNAADIARGEKRETLLLLPNKTDPLRSNDVKLYVVRFDAEQAARTTGAVEGAYLALWRKCPHLGCTIPWVDNFAFTDPLNGQNVTGWFRCPCHGSTYTDAGRRVFGPAPRSMDAFALRIAADGTMTVDLGTVFKSVSGNAEQAQVLPG